MPSSNKISVQISVINKKIEIDGFQIIPIPTHHSKHVKSQAYLVSKAESLFYTQGI